MLATGQQMEERARQYLTQQGLLLVEQNYRCRQGEIDLIMQDKEQLVFVEVKYRHNNHYGSGADAVSLHKQQKIIRAAKHYLHRYQIGEQVSCRFDVVMIEADKNNEGNNEGSLVINWIPNAFM